MKPLLVEAEGFAELGGWVVDQQFMDCMGSPFLLAHGMGCPVADAVERIPAGRLKGEFRLWVRTRDWVAPHGPGRFTVRISSDGGTLLETRPLGVGDGEWHWEDCGVAESGGGELELRLRDLTGFDGRCDAVLFTPPECVAPSPEWDDWEWRRRALGLPAEPEERRYDFVVVGGGYAGMCAAVAAARRGAKTALVQDRPVFGGNASSEVRVGPIGRLGLPPFPRNSDLAYELAELTRGSGETSGGVRPPPDDSRLAAWLAAERNLETFAFTRCTGVETKDGRIASVVVRNVRTAAEARLSAAFFCDATGDAWLARAAGAETRFAPETQEETGETLAPKKGAPPNGGYGATNYWLTRRADGPRPFPPCPWALRIDAESAEIGEARSAVKGDYPYAAGWNWESGFHADNVAEGEAIRDYNLRAAYGMWDWLKNRSPERAKYADAELSWMACVLGKRAAWRIVGDYVLNERDLTEGRIHYDGVVTTTWYLDMHFPHPRNTRYFPGAEFRSFAYDDPDFESVKAPGTVGRYTPVKPTPIPFRCLYSKDLVNLFMAGKDISATYVAMASVRVENTTAQMGQVVGIAAAMCAKRGWTPRGLGASRFAALAAALRDPWRRTRLARRGQGRRTAKDELRHWLRVAYHKLKKALGFPYLAELAG